MKRRSPTPDPRAHLRISLGATLVAGAGLLVAGCTSATDLDPAPGATPPPPDLVGARPQSGMDVVENVQVIASGRAWPGAAPIRREVTAVRVRIENDSDRPIRVDYPHFSLMDPDDPDQKFRALAPFAVEGEVDQRRLVPDYDPFQPTWFGRNYYVYDPFSVYYDGFPTYPAPYTWVDADWVGYDSYWRDRTLPTMEMVTRALPPGVVEPGGIVDGWIYFEKVDEDEGRIYFEAEIVDATDGDLIGQARIPFETDEVDRS